ncbi:MAG TPA: hypothetical protein VG917_04915 [Patescibacteria group bacterium]|nr:hypothetical protein [Patescibacteria group bacterium]
MEKEGKRLSIPRRVEVAAEKVGGGIMVLRGLLAWSAATVGVGAFLMMLGYKRGA